MPSFSFDELDGRERRLMLTNVVIPRPIAWISSLAPDGIRNLAPYSYCNVASTNPPIVHFTSTGAKDSLRNVMSTGEFVVNLVSTSLVEQMNVTAANLPSHEDEFAWAGLEAAPSRRVSPPRVAEAQAALECTARDICEVGRGTMVFGDVLLFHIADSVWRDGRVDPHVYEPVGRLGGSYYTRVNADIVRSIPRLTWEDLQAGEA